MFGSIKEKFLSVQDGISARFSGLSVGEPVREKKKRPRDADLSAGARILDKYHKDWKEMHALAEGNAILGQNLDREISSLYRIMETKKAGFYRLVEKLESVPRLTKQAEDVVNTIGAMRQTIEELEVGLISLQDLVERQEQELKKVRIHKELLLFSKERGVFPEVSPTEPLGGKQIPIPKPETDSGGPSVMEPL